MSAFFYLQVSHLSMHCVQMYFNEKHIGYAFILMHYYHCYFLAYSV